jgi:hypothetical protein
MLSVSALTTHPFMHPPYHHAVAIAAAYAAVTIFVVVQP